MSVVFGGTIFAQYYDNTENYNPNGYATYFNQAYPFSPGDYEDVGYPSAYLQRNGQIITAEDNWQDYEVAAFVNGVLRGFIFMTDINSDWLPIPIFEGIFVYNTLTNEPVNFKVYDHSTGMEYDCTTNIAIVTGDDTNYYGVYDDPDGTSPESLIISFTTSTTAITKDIIGYESEQGNGSNWYLIASPVGEVDPANVDNMLQGNYDLYAFDQAQELEWLNYKSASFMLEPGKGYLYANSADVTLSFNGSAYTGSGNVTLTKTEGVTFSGWNLVGNPFNETSYIDRDYYVMNDNGDEIILADRENNFVNPMEGIFVIAGTDEETLTFSAEPSSPGGSEGGGGGMGPGDEPDFSTGKFSINITNGVSVVDRAVVRLGKGRTLPKLQLNPNHTKVYFPVEGNDYAVMRSEGMGEMPVSFKAEKNGSYSLYLNSKNVNFAYLHLIDNLTGADVDLLQTSSYTFDARTTDYASRFRLVFATTDDNEDNFAFIDAGGNFVINNEGEATLQVVDVTGRMLRSETINGCASVKLNAAPGVYMLRLINGNDMKVQKMVVR